MTTLSAQVKPERLREVDGRALLALRWYERAQGIEVPEDRYVALWIALEALAGGPGTDFLKRVWELIVAALGGPAQAEVARSRIDLRALRDLRNRIMVGAGREQAPTNVEFTVSAGTLRILEALVEDTLRDRLSIARTQSLANAISQRAS
ncbi:MAG: hypothetical protein HYY34_05920 [Chloroflexi bacterium]|nr:hypothetical protein [Chloroflexota bacterium]